MIDRNNMQGQIIGRTSLQYRTWGGIVNPMLMAVPMQSTNAFSVMQVTNNFNLECNNLLKDLSDLKENLQNAVNEKLNVDPNYPNNKKFLKMVQYVVRKDIIKGMLQIIRMIKLILIILNSTNQDKSIYRMDIMVIGGTRVMLR